MNLAHAGVDPDQPMGDIPVDGDWRSVRLLADGRHRRCWIGQTSCLPLWQSTTRGVPGLPQIGPVYVRLMTYVGGSWKYNGLCLHHGRSPR